MRKKRRTSEKQANNKQRTNPKESEGSLGVVNEKKTKNKRKASKQQAKNKP